MEIEDGVIVNILFFARSKELAGKRKATLCIPAKLNYQTLLDTLTKNYNLEAIKNSVLLAINEEVVSEDAEIKLTPHDSIAIIPPLSGG